MTMTGVMTISQAAKILGVNKKTLMRWDDSGRFSPTRESVSNIRVYDRAEVESLKIIRNHERRYREAIKQLRETLTALSSYARQYWLDKQEMDLSDELERLQRTYEKLNEEFDNFGPSLKELHKQFFLNRWG